MAVPAKWTLDSFGDDPEVQSELPQPVDITRAALADPAFDVEAFLNTHSQFRTLRDTQLAVRVWEEKLHAELVGVMNENFRDFVGSAASLEAGKSYLDDINSDISAFSKHAGRVSELLEKKSDALDRELANHKRLCTEEGQARQLLYMFDLLEELENALHEVELPDSESLESLARAYVAIVAVAENVGEVKAVELLRVSIERAQQELLESLRTAIAAADSDASKLRLVEACEWVGSSKLGAAHKRYQ